MINKKGIKIWFLGLFLGLLALVAVAPATGEAAMVSPDEREMKLLLKVDTFSERDKGYQEIWSAVKKVAAEMGVCVKDEENPFKEEVKRVVFYDTNNMDLTRKDYIIRQRIKFVDGQSAATCDLTLKYRTTGVDAVSSEAVATAAGYKPAISYQEDYVGFFNGIIGKANGEMSVSHTLKKVPLSEQYVLGDFISYFPTLADLGISQNEPLYIINTVAVKEYKVSPGELDFGGIKGGVDISLWYNYDTGKPITAEISWECAKSPAEAVAKAEAFFNALQGKVEKLLYPGQMKAKFIFDYKK